ncbi:carbohydrate sulfotransferase 15-like isoform X2 [Amphiura filiformis]|uniref:carbohydrate sulfotransferase 15-like isoform X2 n=1 Tax=Amphiura filiformis TaxID=82378 RepID=UPI003B22105A
MAKILSTTIVIVFLGYLFLVYTKLTINPLDLSAYKEGSQPAIDWKNASRLYLTAPQVFAQTPGKFLPGFKNPCWPKESGDGLLCLPYFYLAGMPKCGTTDLWRKLIQHPLIAKTSKEPHWWTRKRLGYYNIMVSPNGYYDRMAMALKKASRSSGIGRSKLILGDGSASTLWDNRNWTRIYPHHQEGPPHIIAEVIASIQPSAKTIVILRNPTERLYSDYLFITNSTTISPQDFHSRVVTSIRRWSQCTTQHERRTCTYRRLCYEKNGCSGARIYVGMYSVYLADWLQFFPRNQTLVIRMKDWHDHCVDVLRTIHEFLKLYPLRSGELYRICEQEKANIRADDKKHIGPMLDQTRKILDQFYDPFNVELADLLNDDRFLWR